MRTEKRYFFAHVFGFAGLPVVEMIHHAADWWRGLQAPYLMPHVWRAMLALAFAVGGVIGCAIAVYTLRLRGLL